MFSAKEISTTGTCFSISIVFRKYRQSEHPLTYLVFRKYRQSEHDLTKTFIVMFLTINNIPYSIVWTKLGYISVKTLNPGPLYRCFASIMLKNQLAPSIIGYRTQVHLYPPLSLSSMASYVLTLNHSAVQCSR